MHCVARFSKFCLRLHHILPWSITDLHCYVISWLSPFIFYIVFLIATRSHNSRICWNINHRVVHRPTISQSFINSQRSNVSHIPKLQNNIEPLGNDLGGFRCRLNSIPYRNNANAANAIDWKVKIYQHYNHLSCYNIPLPHCGKET